VIYPGVEVDEFVIGPGPREDFYLTASRLVPYKKVQLIVEAFSQMKNRKLVIIGSGPLYKQIKARAASNVSVLGFQPFPVLLEHMQKQGASFLRRRRILGSSRLRPKPAALLSWLLEEAQR
jgi:glycosyltransferase involved in cell wall biosynthesis